MRKIYMKNARNVAKNYLELQALANMKIFSYGAKHVEKK